VLREEVAQGRDAKFFQGILDKINTVQYFWKKDFKIRKKRSGKKFYVVRGQELARLDAQDFKKKKFSEKEARYFDWVMTRKWSRNGFVWQCVFREPWRFVLKIEPNIIRRTKIKDFDLERRAKEIDQYFAHNNRWEKALKVVYGRHRWRWRSEEELPWHVHPFRNRSFADILQEHLPEHEPRIMRAPEPRGFSFLWREGRIQKRVGDVERVNRPLATASRPIGTITVSQRRGHWRRR
jgi:hypothetical protein